MIQLTTNSSRRWRLRGVRGRAHGVKEVVDTVLPRGPPLLGLGLMDLFRGDVRGPVRDVDDRHVGELVGTRLGEGLAPELDLAGLPPDPRGVAHGLASRGVLSAARVRRPPTALDEAARHDEDEEADEQKSAEARGGVASLAVWAPPVSFVVLRADLAGLAPRAARIVRLAPRPAVSIRVASRVPVAHRARAVFLLGSARRVLRA